MSATIYEFPVRGRFVAGSPKEDMKSAANVVLALRAPKTVIGSSWYHEEAIEAEQAPKN
jgi:hypothetical protein